MTTLTIKSTAGYAHKHNNQAVSNHSALPTKAQADFIKHLMKDMTRQQASDIIKVLSK